MSPGCRVSRLGECEAAEDRSKPYTQSVSDIRFSTRVTVCDQAGYAVRTVSSRAASELYSSGEYRMGGSKRTTTHLIEKGAPDGRAVPDSHQNGTHGSRKTSYLHRFHKGRRMWLLKIQRTPWDTAGLGGMTGKEKPQE